MSMSMSMAFLSQALCDTLRNEAFLGCKMARVGCDVKRLTFFFLKGWLAAFSVHPFECFQNEPFIFDVEVGSR